MVGEDVDVDRPSLAAWIARRPRAVPAPFAAHCPPGRRRRKHREFGQLPICTGLAAKLLSDTITVATQATERRQPPSGPSSAVACRRTPRTPPLVPADPGDRELLLAVRVSPPSRCSAWPARAVDERLHGQSQVDGLPPSPNRDLPNCRSPNPAGIDEGLELAVGHLVPVDEDARKAAGQGLEALDRVSIRFFLSASNPRVEGHAIALARDPVLSRRSWPALGRSKTHLVAGLQTLNRGAKRDLDAWHGVVPRVPRTPPAPRTDLA